MMTKTIIFKFENGFNGFTYYENIIKDIEKCNGRIWVKSAQYGINQATFHIKYEHYEEYKSFLNLFKRTDSYLLSDLMEENEQ